MYHITVRAGVLGVLLALAGAGFATLPSAAVAQTSFSSSNDGLPDAPDGPTKRIPQKTPFAFRASEFVLAGATTFDMSTTVVSLDHPTTAHGSDGLIVARYYAEEQGWAGMFGKRDAWTAVTANVFLNAGIDRYSRRLSARGGRWRALGYGMNFAKAAFNTGAAISNIRNNERIDQRVRRATGYKGPIYWTP